MFLARSACIRPWRDRLYSHYTHQPLDPLPVHLISLKFQPDFYLTAAVKGMSRIFLIDQAHQHLIFRTHS